MMFEFKKIVGPLFYPLPFCFIVIIIGLLLLWFTRRQITGKIVITIGACLLYLSGNIFIADSILKPLEREYPKYSSMIPVKFIVVLGAGHCIDPELPFTSYLTDQATARLVEGIRLHRKHPGSRLVLTGAGVAQTVADVAVAIGVDPNNIVISDDSFSLRVTEKTKSTNLTCLMARLLCCAKGRIRQVCNL
jgi:uncharacterized SAM-binding protein YcdF (DUF218 family)